MFACIRGQIFLFSSVPLVVGFVFPDPRKSAFIRGKFLLFSATPR